MSDHRPQCSVMATYEATKYEPNDHVVIAHSYPHLNPRTFQEETDTFLGEDGEMGPYFLSLLTFPIIIGGICFLSLNCFWLYLFFRDLIKCCKWCGRNCCCRSCCEIVTCCKTPAKDKKRNTRLRQIYTGLLYFFLVAGFVSSSVTFEAQREIEDSANNMLDALQYFGNITNSIANEVSMMSNHTSNVQDFLHDNVCPESSLDPYLDEFGTTLGRSL